MCNDGTDFVVAHRHFAFADYCLSIIKQNWNQYLLAVKATVLKQQISKFCPQIQHTDASDHIYVTQWPVINVKASLCV